MDNIYLAILRATPKQQRGVNPLPLIQSICQNGVVNICRLNPFLIRTIERIKCPTGKLDGSARTTLSLKLFADVCKG